MFKMLKGKKTTTATNPAAVAAARWWGDQLRNGAKLDNGDDSPTGGMTFALAAILQDAERDSTDLSEERIQQFEEKLAEAISARLERSSGYGVTVSVDYHPDQILVEAAQFAGIQSGMTLFPWKTTMWVKDSNVEVSAGYRTESVKVPIG